MMSAKYIDISDQYQINSQWIQRFNRFGIVFDSILILFSILDQIAHILVIIMLYFQEQYILFSISVAIIAIAFTVYFFLVSEALDVSMTKRFICYPFICPMACILIILNYFWQEPDPIATDGLLQNWTHRNKVGMFVLQALIQSFPMSIITMSVILILSNQQEHTHYVYQISLLLSLLFIMLNFLLATNCCDEWSRFLFVWLSFINDIFGIYFLIIWVFVPLSTDGDCNIFTSVVYLEFVIGILPVVVAGIVIYLFTGWLLCFMFFWDSDYSICEGIGYTLLALVISPILLCLSPLILAIPCFTWLNWLYLDNLLIDSNHTNTKNAEHLIYCLINFISKADNHNDKILRILSTNIIFDETSKLSQYMASMNELNRVHMTTYREIRQYTDPAIKILTVTPKECITEFMDEFIDNEHFLLQMVVCFIAPLLFIFIPLYIVTRTFRILYPWIIIIEMTATGSWDNVDWFHLAVLAICVVIQFGIITIGGYTLRIHYWLIHIFPTHDKREWDKWDEEWRREYFVKVKDFYQPFAWRYDIQIIITNILGHDIKSIVMQYYDAMELDESA